MRQDDAPVRTTRATTVRARLVLVLALLILGVLGATSPVLACVVGTGTSASCAETALDACLPGGGSFNGTVTFACGGAATITVTSTKFISANTTIDGGSVITISGGGTVRVFYVSYSVTFTVENLTIANGLADGRGGAILNYGSLTVTNSIFSGNRVITITAGSAGGGAISNGDYYYPPNALLGSWSLTVSNSTFTGNGNSATAAAGGGAIRNYEGLLTVTNSTFSGNSADVGGAIVSSLNANPSRVIVVTNSTFSGNSALVFYGGAIATFYGSLRVTDSAFSGNTAPRGGAIFGSSPTVTNSTFSSNSATGTGAFIAANGGAIDAGSTPLTVTNSTFSGNTANQLGGAISNNAGSGGPAPTTVTNCTFSGNNAGGGGAITSWGSTLTVTNSTFSGNSATTGGALLNYFSSFGAGTVTVTNSILAKSASGNNCAVFQAAPITDGGHNIDDGTTCGFAGTGCAATTGTSFCNTDPKLDPAGLASNGGPTQTIALESGSPAINAGDETVCAAPPVNNLDQRGFVRPGMGATNCSIGAYEFDSLGPPTTTTTTTSSTTTSTTSTTTSTVPVQQSTTSTMVASSTTSTTIPPACDLAQLPEDSLAGVECAIGVVRTTLNEPPQPSCTCKHCSLAPALDRIAHLVMQADTATSAKKCKGSLKTEQRAAKSLRAKVASVTRSKCLAPVDRAASLGEVTDLVNRTKALRKSAFCAGK